MTIAGRIKRSTPPQGQSRRLDSARVALELEALEERKRLELFVGREPELATFRRALEGVGPRVLYVWGPGGIGKTTLLAAFAAEARQRGRATARIDARHIELTPTSVLAAFERMGVVTAARSRVVLIDTYEHLRSLEPLVVRELLRHVHGDALMVVAARTPPSADWRALSLWGSAVAAMPLRNLEPDAAAAYLARCGMGPEVSAAVRAFAHGHPLALALAAEAWRLAPDRPFTPEQSPDLVGSLYEFFVREVTAPDRRAALEAAAVLCTTSEEALSAMLERDARAAFAWLRDLSFMRIGRRGVVPHDLARDVILAELRWRHPARLAALALRAQRYYLARMRTAADDEELSILDEFVFVLGHNPRMRAMLVHPEEGLIPDDLRPGDEQAIEAATLRHEGPAAAQHLRHWLKHRPRAFKVVRNRQGTVVGFGLFLWLEQTSAEERAHDPVVRAAWDHATMVLGESAKEGIAFTRFILACESGQASSSAMGVCLRMAVHTLFLRRAVQLAFMRLHANRAWDRLAAMSGVRFVSELAHESDGNSFEVTMLDLRGVSPIELLTSMNERAAVDESRASDLQRALGCEPALAALSCDEFAVSVRDALRALREPSLLASNPLVQAQIVRRVAAAGASPSELGRVLHEVMRQAIEALRGTERGDTWALTLERAYLGAGAKHTTVATELGLTYGTFRRQLTAAIEHLIAELWERELAASARPTT